MFFIVIHAAGKVPVDTDQHQLAERFKHSRPQHLVYAMCDIAYDMFPRPSPAVCVAGQNILEVNQTFKFPCSAGPSGREQGVKVYD